MVLWDAEHMVKPRILNIFLRLFCRKLSPPAGLCRSKLSFSSISWRSWLRSVHGEAAFVLLALNFRAFSCGVRDRATQMEFFLCFSAASRLVLPASSNFRVSHCGVAGHGARTAKPRKHKDSQSLEEETAKQRTKSAVEPAGAAGYLRRTNTNDLILFFQKFCCGQANAASADFPVQCQNILASFVQISWPPVAPVVSEGIFSSIHSSGPEMNISEYDILLSSKKGPGRLIHPPTCENHGAAQTRNIPPTDISKIFSSRGVAYNPEEIS
ncbi:hypothetical protein C8J57DRAFT_1236663 [Mycena rebaudengoi]|nr:hypothetical protein C8J57DRAFT_1236663 [Mycena rebaudengoi]